MIRFQHKEDPKSWHEFKYGVHPDGYTLTQIVEQRTNWNPDWIVSSFDTLVAARNWFLSRGTWVEVLLQNSPVADLDVSPPSQPLCKCEFRTVWMSGCQCGGI